jgi:hypothetical protein
MHYSLFALTQSAVKLRQPLSKTADYSLQGLLERRVSIGPTKLVQSHLKGDFAFLQPRFHFLQVALLLLGQIIEIDTIYGMRQAHCLPSTLGLVPTVTLKVQLN